MRRLVLMLLVATMAATCHAQQNKSTTKKPATAAKKPATTAKKPATTAKKPAATTKNNKATTAKKKAQQPETVKSLQGKRQQIQKNIKEQKQKLAQNEKTVRQRLQNLMMLNSEIEQKRQTIDTIKHSLAVLDTSIVALSQDLDTLTKELDDRRMRYKKSMRYMRQNRSIQNKMMFIFSAKSFNQMYRRSRFMQEYSAYQKAQGEAVKQKQEQVQQKLAELNSAKDQQKKLLNRGEEERKQLETKQTEQQKVVSTLQREQKTIQGIIATQQKEDAALNLRLERLIAAEAAKAKARAEAEAKRKAEEEAKRKAQAAKTQKSSQGSATAKNSKPTKNNSSTKNNPSSKKATAKNNTPAAKPKPETFVSQEDRRISGSFESNKGRLPMPITGSYRIVNGYGQYDVEGLKGVRLESKGLHIKGQDGARARSIFDGEVSGVYQIAPNMFVVMVRHGSYISVYCNLSSVNVHRGEKVSTRQVLGGLASGTVLQFQLRRWTETLNPMRWLGR